MKNYIQFILPLILLVASCNDDQESVTPEPQLPPITSEGNNTFGCLIDGELFLARKSTAAFMEPDPLFYAHYVDSVLYISANDIEKSKYVILNTIFYGDELKLPVYNPNARDYGSISQYIDFNIKIGGARYFVNMNGTDSMVILHNDQNIIAGTFEFEAIGEDLADTIHITEGRFDIAKH